MSMLASRAAALRSAEQGHGQSPFRPRSAATAAAAAAAAVAGRAKAKPWGDYVPVYGALGAVAMSATLGLGTALLQLAHAPNVRVDKKKRETVPEVAAPDLALGEAERFVGSSLFRKVARVQQDAGAPVVYGYRPVKKAVTLKDAGVDPPGIEKSREEVLGSISSFKRNSV